MPSLAILNRKTRTVILVASLICADLTAGQTMYTITDLGTLGGRESHALGISDAAHVVGWSETGETDESGSPIRHAFLWHDGTMTDLGTLGGLESTARRVNGAGQVVGWAEAPMPPPLLSVRRAFLWLPEAAYGLPSGMNDLGEGEAYDINERAQVVGLLGTWWHSVFLWLPEPAFGLSAGLKDLGDGVGVCGKGQPLRINDRGQIAFCCGVWLPTPDYGIPAGWITLWLCAYDMYFDAQTINNRGLVVAFFETWSSLGVVAIDLATRTDSAPGVLCWGDYCGLNDAGLLVSSDGIAQYDYDAGTWRVSHLGSWLFPHAEWLFVGAADISQYGQITGFGETKSGDTHAVVLTPVDADFDDDEDTDAVDFKRWQACLAGPRVDVELECRDRDIDRDGDIDLIDFYGLQRLFTGR
jgi:probable HAF family extracellular repeat protein